jgi:hypothetical protein
MWTDVKPLSITSPANDSRKATSGSLVWLSTANSGTEKHVQHAETDQHRAPAEHVRREAEERLQRHIEQQRAGGDQR